MNTNILKLYDTIEVYTFRLIVNIFSCILALSNFNLSFNCCTYLSYYLFLNGFFGFILLLIETFNHNNSIKFNIIKFNIVHMTFISWGISIGGFIILLMNNYSNCNTLLYNYAFIITISPLLILIIMLLCAIIKTYNDYKYKQKFNILLKKASQEFKKFDSNV
jgi:hypothetical protein